MKIQNIQLIDCNDWDQFVIETYNKPYCFQQQDDCKSRGVFYLIVPNEAADYENNTIPEVVNHPTMGVSFAAWLARDSKQPLSDKEKLRTEPWVINLWWERNFYPDIQMIANDLHDKDLLKAGEYLINIDW